MIYVEALLKAYVQTREGLVRRIRRNDASDDDTIRLGQYWTLGARDGRWVLLSIEESSEGEHHLSAPIVGVPWSDDRLRDDALIEMAAADKLPPGFEPGAPAPSHLAGAHTPDGAVRPGEWLASHVGGACPHLLTDHGPLPPIVDSLSQILDELVAPAG